MPISSVVLSSQRVPLSDALYSVQQKLPAEPVNPLVFDGQKLIPSVTRVFSKGRDLYVFLQAYQRAATTTQPLVAVVAFYRDEAKVFETAPLAVVDGLDPQDEGGAAAVSPCRSTASRPAATSVRCPCSIRQVRRPLSGARRS